MPITNKTLLTLKQHVYNPIRNRIKRLKEYISYLYFLQKKIYRKFGSTNSSISPRALLFVGSGKSALDYQKHNLDGVEILTVNNSIKAFQRKIDYYMCSTDFPKDRKPSNSQYKTLVLKPSYFYNVLNHARYHKLKFRPNVGKTIFLDGLYWAMAMGYKKIYLLGFDHDYNPNRIKKWDGKYTLNQSKLEELFDGPNEEPDAFYGQGTPDPLRHGQFNLVEMFEKAKEHAKEYQCQIINLSNRKGMIEVFDRKEAIEPY